MDLEEKIKNFDKMMMVTHGKIFPDSLSKNREWQMYLKSLKDFNLISESEFEQYKYMFWPMDEKLPEEYSEDEHHKLRQLRKLLKGKYNI